MAETISLNFSTGRVIKRTKDATEKAFASVAGRMQTRLKKAISRQVTVGLKKGKGKRPVKFKKRSKPGNYPKKDTGLLHGTVNVSAKGRKITITTQDYGVFLDKGFSHAKSGRKVQRPWITPLIFEKDARRTWERRFNTAMRKHSK